MATDAGLAHNTSPLIIMSDEYSAARVTLGGPTSGGVVVGEQSFGGLPRLVVPGLTPRSSTSSQSCLSVPGTAADING